MAIDNRVPILLVSIALVSMAIGLNQAEGTTHTVEGWALMKYNKYAAAEKFTVGDTLVFKYIHGQHNVLRVTREDFFLCNGSNPIANYATGDDFVTLVETGDHFFICGVKSHCLTGQKLNILVKRDHSASSPPPFSLYPVVRVGISLLVLCFLY
ncbi:Early nodulin-like protein [Thalictrum thalictroides]|uniref:Early nodulin-like protein n=1 Tax=Thalictrum thalictroides TaxID=46969 RepID=A0A7J6V5A6_THATH|nr:Early nodulin-like protein [Thalictrum thalictroides]